MKTPQALQTLVEEGMVDRVLGSLKSGKEASVFLVEYNGALRCAKVYKDANQRGFHRLAEYQEGRKRRGSREQRALAKGSRYGRQTQESAWQKAEVEALYRLTDAGVRVPRPYAALEAVLIMELVVDAEGRAAPRLNDIDMEAAQACEWHAFLLDQVVRMLCAGLIHGDLSEYNILAGAEGPVIIDLPQAVDAAGNNQAFRMLERDVNNLRSYFGRFAPELLDTQYAREIWQLFEMRRLAPGMILTGQYAEDLAAADTEAVLYEIEQARREAEARVRGRVEAEAGHGLQDWERDGKA